jgi:hypothetical protein
MGGAPSPGKPTTLSLLASGAPGAIAVPAGAPWPVVMALVLLGIIPGATLALMRERHRHNETRTEETHRHAETLAALRRSGLDAAAIVTVLRNGRHPPNNQPG